MISLDRSLVTKLGVLMIIGIWGFMNMSTTQATESVALAFGEKWNAAFNTGDIDALQALYAEDARLSAGDGNILEGREAVKSLFQGFIDAGVHNHTISLIRAQEEQGMVHVLAEWSAQMKNDQGELITMGGVLTNLLQKTDSGDWVSSTHIWNAKQ